MSRSNSQFLGASVHEFMQIWALSGDATLNLTTSGGNTTVEFKCTLGQPGAPHSLPPSPPFSFPPSVPHRPRHRGPAERERNRRRAACHQASQAKTTASVSPIPTHVPASDSVAAEPSPVPVDPIRTSVSPELSKDTEVTSEVLETEFKCKECDYISMSAKGLSIHRGKQHKIHGQICGSDDNGLQCDLCKKNCISENKLKIHKAKWHTNIAPMYGNITRQLDFREKFNATPNPSIVITWDGFSRRNPPIPDHF